MILINTNYQSGLLLFMFKICTEKLRNEALPNIFKLIQHRNSLIVSQVTHKSFYFQNFYNNFVMRLRFQRQVKRVATSTEKFHESNSVLFSSNEPLTLCHI